MSANEIVLYVSQPFKKYRWIGIMSSIQVGFVLMSLASMPTNKLFQQRRTAQSQSVVKRKMDTNEFSMEPDGVIDGLAAGHESATLNLWASLRKFKYNDLFSPKNIKDNVLERKYFSLGLILGSVFVSSALYTYARRNAHVITLLPHQRIRFESFSMFGLGQPPSIELPVRDVSCVVGRTGNTNYSILKFKGYLGYHLVHKKDGVFLQPELYDEHLGYDRSWYNR